jgi:hypothetical protein
MITTCEIGLPMPFYVYCSSPSFATGPAGASEPVVFAQGEFESRAQAQQVIQRTRQLLTAFEASPEVTEPVWQIVEAESLEAAQALVALLGRPLSPN